MSEPLAKPRTMINLDEFERRLRRPSTVTPTDSDPLAELARLVGGQQDSLDAVFNQPVNRQPVNRPAAQPPMQPRAVPPQFDGRWDVPPQVPPQTAPSQQPPRQVARRAHPLAGDFAAIEAGLRGTIPPEANDFSAMRGPAPQNASAAPAYAAPEPDVNWDEGEPFTHFSDEPEPLKARSRRPLYITGAIILVGLAGIGGSFALKRPASASGEIAIIKAADGPNKVQAADNLAADKPDPDATILEKGPQPTPVALVNRVEQPVDISQAARTASLPASQLATGAASVPVPSPPSQSGPGATAPQMGIGDLIEPRRVKTISVRPDGTLVNDASSAPQTQSAPEAPTPVARPSSAAKVATPKAAARVMTTPKMQVATANPESERTAAQDRDDAGAAQPRQRTAALGNEASNSTAAGKGDFAVQLAAPGTEEEARQSITHLGKKFAGVLGSRHLTFHHAAIGTKSVYRVRVGGLSHEEAIGLCEKLKSSGGTCFVAKN